NPNRLVGEIVGDDATPAVRPKLDLDAHAMRPPRSWLILAGRRTTVQGLRVSWLLQRGREAHRPVGPRARSGPIRASRGSSPRTRSSAAIPAGTGPWPDRHAGRALPPAGSMPGQPRRVFPSR